jgi:hypothetical protein
VDHPFPGRHAVGITLVIVIGLTAMTLIGVAFDYLSKKSNGLSGENLKRLHELENRVATLENGISLRDEELQKLKDEVTFFGKLLEDKSKA